MAEISKLLWKGDFEVPYSKAAKAFIIREGDSNVAW